MIGDENFFAKGGLYMSTIPGWFVILMGMGTVFVGLICIVLLCKLLGTVCSINRNAPKCKPHSPVTTPSSPLAPTISAANRQEIIAAIGAAIAEECGVDGNGIRITSIKRI